METRERWSVRIDCSQKWLPNAIKEQLRSPREYLRIRARNAISVLFAIDASLGDTGLNSNAC